jgi:hypothetical protein
MSHRPDQHSQTNPAATASSTRRLGRAPRRTAGGSGVGGVILESRTADVAIMTRMELPIPAPASQVSARVRRAACLRG